MRALFLSAGLICALTAAAQETNKQGLTAEQIIERSIDATGGRAALEKLTSTIAKGSVEMRLQSTMKASMEFYAKAPNKRLIVTNIEGFGAIRQGYDGKVGWSDDPARGVVELSGDQLAGLQREATFNAALKWREMFPKVEMLGKENVGDRDAYALRLTPAAGKPVTQYYDALTFLILRQKSTQETPQGPMEVTVDFFDFRDVGGGVKAPFLVKQKLPVGEIDMTMTEMQNNVEIDDAKFSKPAEQ